MLIKDIKKLSIQNEDFRHVLFTGRYSQVVLMAIEDEIGMEIHPFTDQIIFITEGNGEAIVGEESHEIYEDDIIFVPAGTRHNFINKGETPLKLYTIYGPPAHPEGTVEKTRDEAIAKEG